MNIEITGEGDYLISPKIDEVIKNFSVTTENGKTTFSVTGEEASVAQTSEEKTLDATEQKTAAPKEIVPEYFAQESEDGQECETSAADRKQVAKSIPTTRTSTVSKEPTVKAAVEKKSEETEKPNCADCRAEYRERIKYVDPEYSKETKSEEPMRTTETCTSQKVLSSSEKCVQCIGTCTIGKEIFRWFSCGAAVAFGAVALALMAFKKKD